MYGFSILVIVVATSRDLFANPANVHLPKFSPHSETPGTSTQPGRVHWPTGPQWPPAVFSHGVASTYGMRVFPGDAAIPAVRTPFAGSLATATQSSTWTSMGFAWDVMKALPLLLLGVARYGLRRPSAARDSCARASSVRMCDSVTVCECERLTV